MIEKPMLAATIKDVIDLKFPLLATPKLDGIRCIIKDGIPVSRNFKPLPNKEVQECFKGLPDNLDGELIITGQDFNGIQSVVMSEEGTCEGFPQGMVYMIFDYAMLPNEPYTKRVELYQKLDLFGKRCARLTPVNISSLEELAELEKIYICCGFEGVMLRTPNSPYKFGRSTMREQYLMKLKRFEDSEAIIIGFEEQMHNDNPVEVNEVGNNKRAKKKENMKPAGTLGMLLVKDIPTGIEFGLGTGFTAQMRKTIWENQATYMGKIVNYKYQGIVDKPRFPSFRGFRSKNDL